MTDAIERLARELKHFKGGKKEEAIKHAVANALMDFCRQEPEFARAVEESEKTLSDCCASVLKGVGNSISDLEAYRRAVRFYFHDADIRYQMTVELREATKAKATPSGTSCPQGGIVLDLTDFL